MREHEADKTNTPLPGMDQNTFCQMYDNCRQDLYRYALYRLGSREEAEDAVQDAVLDAWRQLGSLRSVAAFRGWIFRILSGKCSRRIRNIVHEREKTEAAAARLQEGSQQSAAAGSAGEQAERRVALEQALARLSEDEREIVLLSAVAGLTSAEIAEQTGMQPGGVRSKLSRSLARMREYLA